MAFLEPMGMEKIRVPANKETVISEIENHIKSMNYVERVFLDVVLEHLMRKFDFIEK